MTGEATDRNQKFPPRGKFFFRRLRHILQRDSFHIHQERVEDGRGLIARELESGHLALLAAAMLELDFSFFGKNTLFRGPLGWFLRHMGGIPLDRSRNQSFVSQAVSWFDSHERFALGVAPEGTRYLTAGWKTGFYHIAAQAKVPIVLGYIDYSRKEGGILPEILVPTGDIERDFKDLARLYGPCVARHPERKAPIVPLRRETQDPGSETPAAVSA